MKTITNVTVASELCHVRYYVTYSDNSKEQVEIYCGPIGPAYKINEKRPDVAKWLEDNRGYKF